MGLRPQSHIGRLDKGLDEAPAKGWTVVDMKTRLETGVSAGEIEGPPAAKPPPAWRTT